MPVNVGFTKNPVQPTPAASSNRVVAIAKIWSLRVLGIVRKPLGNIALAGRNFRIGAQEL
jgi:hypothetical protein